MRRCFDLTNDLCLALRDRFEQRRDDRSLRAADAADGDPIAWLQLFFADNRIDYIFLSNPPSGHSRLKTKSVRVNGYLDAKVGALSDHSAVEGELEWVNAQ